MYILIGKRYFFTTAVKIVIPPFLASRLNAGITIKNNVYRMIYVIPIFEAFSIFGNIRIIYAKLFCCKLFKSSVFYKLF